MIIFTNANSLTEYLSSKNQSISFVPTMGALHPGHISLIRIAKKNKDLALASIFVNPTQFNDVGDLEKYPRTVPQDIELLEQAGCDILFLPQVEEVYPNGLNATEKYDLGNVGNILEGKFRPGHFLGVAQVVDRFLEIIKPQQIILGQKDLQQIAIISRMITVRHPQVEMLTAPTLRDDDGLAKSSRNVRLNATERALAPLIYQTLVSIQAKAEIAPFATVKKEAWEMLERKGFKPEYISLIDRETWQELDDFDQTKSTAVLLAAWLGDVRLIDNILL